MNGEKHWRTKVERLRRKLKRRRAALNLAIERHAEVAAELACAQLECARYYGAEEEDAANGF